MEAVTQEIVWHARLETNWRSGKNEGAIAHRIHVWYIYLQISLIFSECIGIIYHTWILWVGVDSDVSCRICFSDFFWEEGDEQHWTD